MMNGTIKVRDGATYFYSAATLYSEPTMRHDWYRIASTECAAWDGLAATMDRSGGVSFRGPGGTVRCTAAPSEPVFEPVPQPKVRGKCLGMRWNDGAWERLVGTRGWQRIGG